MTELNLFFKSESGAVLRAKARKDGAVDVSWRDEIGLNAWSEVWEDVGQALLRVAAITRCTDDRFSQLFDEDFLDPADFADHAEDFLTNAVPEYASAESETEEILDDPDALAAIAEAEAEEK